MNDACTRRAFVRGAVALTALPAGGGVVHSPTCAGGCVNCRAIAGYYGRTTMDIDRDWVRLSKAIPGCDCRGMMYTQWGQGFSRLEEFAAAVREEEGR